jgi:signal transduction histidine kinase
VSCQPEIVPKVGVALFARDGRLLLHSPRFRELLDGTGAAIFVGAHLRDVLRALGGGDPASGLHVAPADGRAIDIAFETLPNQRCCMTVTDVTEARAARAELRRARLAAEAATIAKSTFLATMTHELRTPLNAVIGFSEALAQSAREASQDPTPPSLDPAQVSEFATAIHQAGQHLLDRINTILDVTRIESGRLELASDLIDVDYMVRHCVLQLRPAAEAAGVRVTAELPPDLPRLRGDERRLRQVVGHLLTNAVKFSQAGGAVAVAASCPPDGGLDILVRDHGIGIAPEDIERVFEPFNQLDTSLSRRIPGAGLGLYAARSLVMAHGGRIRLNSAPGEGTTAIVQFPAHLLAPIPASLELTQDPS